MLSAPEQALLDRTRAFVVKHLRPHSEHRQRETDNSPTWMKVAAEAGLIAVQVPLEHGGLGLSFSCKAEMASIIAGADFGAAMSIVNTHNVAEHVARMGSTTLARTLVPGLLSGEKTACTALTESGAGSDFAAVQCNAVKVNGGWLLNGEKIWITNATHADWVVVYAQTANAGGAAGVAAFVVDAHSPGFERGAEMPLGPVATIGAGSFKLTNYFCDDDYLLAPAGEAFIDIMRSINGARTYVAAMCCAMVDDCLRIVKAYGNTRQAFGKPLLAHQGWRWALADADIDLQAARLLTTEAARAIDLKQDAQTTAARAKVFATRMAQRHIAALMHAMGAEGLHDNYPFMRHLASAQVATLVDGSTEMLLERIAKEFKAA
jgi:alkylation response protein AidB-like acyl-CoA dehydrogenase